MKIVFLADAHLKGLDDPNQKGLVEFLDSLAGIDTLVLLGDIFDFWTGCFKGYVYPQYMPVLDGLMRLRKRGINIICLEGNHDFSMGAFFENDLGARVYSDFFEGDIDGVRMYLAHGDAITGGIGHALWRRILRSRLFCLIMRVAGPQFVWDTAMRMSTKSRAYNKGYENIETRLKAFALRKFKSGAGAVIFGHSHVAGVHMENAEGKTVVYANPGSWASDRSYLLYEGGAHSLQGAEPPQGEFKVKKGG